ncbi:MAG: phage tail protein [Alteromonadaceae bacterium]|nr:phage tail protein [Alteromonadaceae bacterium]
MATSANDIINKYPLPVYHYNVSIDGMEDIRFTEVSGLSIERQLITYKDGLSVTKGNKYLPGLLADPKLTLKKGIVKSDEKLYQWISSLRVTAIDKKNILISLMDESGTAPVVTWKVFDAFPLKLEAPSFNATSNEVAIETLELAATKITVEYQS